MLGSSSSSPRPVRIRSGLKKKQSVGGGQRAGSLVWVSGGQGYRKGCNQRAPWEEEEISEIQTRKDGKE